MVQICAALAILAGGVYAGASWYLAFVELASLKALPVSAAREHWAQSVRRTPRYAVSALVAAAAALVAGRIAFASPWTWGALAIFCVLPFTMAVVLPVQKRLLAAEDLAEWAGDIDRWGRLHAIRLVLGMAAMILFLSQMLPLPS